MIYIIAGTKAQFIKMAPVMVVLEKRGIRYCVIDLSQHGVLGRGMLSVFGINPDVIIPFPRERPVDSVSSGLGWIFQIITFIVFRSDALHAKVFPYGTGVAVVHGDTVSTLLGMLIAKRDHQHVALVEAGLRSGQILSPFPEELIRRFVERWCAILFAPGDNEFKSLKERYSDIQLINTEYNTGRDALMLMRNNKDGFIGEATPVVTVHRLETLVSRRRLTLIIENVLRIASYAGKLRFVMHPPTEKALIKFGLLQTIKDSPHIVCEDLQQYDVFASYLVSAPFILTDGGSIQEEAFYLEKPCIVLRERTERNHGIGSTARLTSWNADDDWDFIKGKLIGKSAIDVERKTMAASEKIANALRDLM